MATLRMPFNFASMALTQQKLLICREVLVHEGRFSFLLYKELVTQGRESEADPKSSFFIRFFEQCFHKDHKAGMFIFDFNKYLKSNVFKLKELPRDAATSIKLHYLSLGLQNNTLRSAQEGN